MADTPVSVIPASDVIAPIGRRLLYSLLGISSLIAVLASALMLWTDYRQGVAEYNKALEQIRSGYQDSITYSLWNFDKRQLETLLQGVSNFPGVVYVQLDHEGTVLHSLGDLYRKSDQRLVIPLQYQNDNGTLPLGSLRVSQNYDDLYNALISRAVEILLSQFLLIFSVAVMLLLIVHRLFARRLQRMADWASTFSLENPDLELTVDRPGDPRDELSYVAAAINTMRATLQDDLRLREQEHEQRKQLQHQLAMAVDNAALGFCRYDLSQDSFHCNNHFASQIGSNELDIETLRQPMEFFISRICGPEAEQQIERIRQLLRGHQVRLHDSFRMLDKQQEERFFDISLQVIRYQDNRPEQVLICMVDRSKELKAREQLNQMRQQQEQEIARQTQELYEAKEALQRKLNDQNRQIQRLRSGRQPHYIQTLCALIAEDIQQWQTMHPLPAMQQWQAFFALDLYAQRTSLDFCDWLRQQAQHWHSAYGLKADLHIPLSLLVQENPAIPEFILRTLLLSSAHSEHTPDRNSSPEPKPLSLHVWVREDHLEARLTLPDTHWTVAPDAHAFRLCQALCGLRYDAELSHRQQEQQQIIHLLLPLASA